MTALMSDDILAGLNDAQREAVQSDAKCSIVLAGPGSGKTRTLTHRIAWLIQNGVDPSSILAVTFTNKAAGEMQERLAGMLGPVARRVVARTFHSFGAKMLRSEIKRLAPVFVEKAFTTDDRREFRIGEPRIGANFAIYDEADQGRLLKHVVTEVLGRDEQFIGPAAHYIERAKNQGLLPNDDTLLQEAAKEPALEIYRDAYAAYQAALLASNACDFDDLILYPKLVFEWFTARLVAYQHHFRHLLVDEYQDTNDVQFDLSVLLAQPDANRIFVVGDEDQSIYGFRFADFRHIGALEEAFEDSQVFLLEQNYRSTPEIVEVADRLIAHNTERAGKRLWTDRPAGGLVQGYFLGDGVCEAAKALELIERVRDGNGRPGVPLDEIAILYRMHALSREIESYLVRAGIPYQVARGTAFYDRLEVRDTLAYAQFIANGDRLAFQRIANVPKRGIGKKTLERILQAAGEGNILQWLQGFYREGQSLALAEAKPKAWKALATRQGLQVSGGFAQRVWELGEVVIGLRQQVEAGATVTELLKEVIEIAKPHWEGLKNPQERIENATELLTVAGRTETPGLDGLQEFLEGVALVSQADDIEESGGVTLATLHAAKGLEWDVVLIIGVEDELIPHRRSVAETGNDEEERRLFYVGVTRARQACYCLGVQRRALFGEVTDHAPSPFLAEMGIDVEVEGIGWSGRLDRESAPI